MGSSNVSILQSTTVGLNTLRPGNNMTTFGHGSTLNSLGSESAMNPYVPRPSMNNPAIASSMLGHATISYRNGNNSLPQYNCYSSYTLPHTRTQETCNFTNKQHTQNEGLKNEKPLTPSIINNNNQNKNSIVNHNEHKLSNTVRESSNSNAFLDTNGFNSHNNETGVRFSTLPKCLSQNLSTSNSHVSPKNYNQNINKDRENINGHFIDTELTPSSRTISYIEGNNKLSNRYRFSSNASLTENIDLVNCENESIGTDRTNSRNGTLRPMPHPRSSRISPSNDPDYANGDMIQTMKKDNKHNTTQKTISNQNTVGIPPISPSTIWPLHQYSTNDPHTGRTSFNETIHSSPVSNLSYDPYESVL